MELEVLRLPVSGSPEGLDDDARSVSSQKGEVELSAAGRVSEKVLEAVGRVTTPVTLLFLHCLTS